MKRREKRTVLFVLSAGGLPNASLLRARAVARAHGAELEVLRVLAAPASHRDGRASAREAIATLRALTATRRWVSEVTHTEPAAGRVRVRTGQFIDVAARRAKEVDAELVVLAPLGSRSGKTATELARRAARPVFVAREATPEGNVLVATDLEVNRAPRSVVVTPVLPPPVA